MRLHPMRDNPPTRLFPLPWYSGGGRGWRSLRLLASSKIRTPTPTLPRSTRGGGIILATTFAILLFSGITHGQTTLPADQSTPRGVMKLLESAAARGDEQSLLHLIQTQSSTEEKYLRAYAENVAAQRSLRKAIATKFPDQAHNDEQSLDQQLSAVDSSIDAMTETINGDTATLGPAEAPDNLRTPFVRVDGRWMLPFDSFFAGATDLDHSADTLRMMSSVLNGIAADVSSGKLKTMDEIREAGQTRMIEAAVRAQASTQPLATFPETRP